MINEFINASAGTGKTYTLLDNIFHYQNGVPTTDYKTAVENINKSVFLTFSNSATEEIKDRLFKGLLKCPNKPEIELSKEIISTDIDIKAYTIHSFALEMVKLFRYKLGLPSEISFSEDENTIWSNCVEEFFAKNWNYNSLKEILNIKNTNKEQVALFELFWKITNKSSFKDFIELKGTTVFFLASMGKTSACNIEDENIRKEVSELFKKIGIDVNSVYSKELQRIKKIIADIESIDLKDLKSIDTIDLNTLQQVSSLLNMCSCFTEKILLYIGETNYMPKMFVNGIFDFDAVIYLFIKELVNTDINKFLQELKDENFVFENLYIDEAQDNDVIQNYFVILFGDPTCPIKVTIVGDAKQSIYGWRNSYPKEFVEIGNECNKSISTNIKNTSLSITRRILSKSTMDAINKICSYLKGIYGQWWYENSKDELKENDSIKENNKKAQLEHWTTTTLVDECRDKLKEFLSEGNNAVLVRKKGNISSLAGMSELLSELGANYRLDLTISDDKKTTKIKTLKPELEFIKIFFGALSQDLSTNVPFTMFWATSGQYITENIFNKLENKDSFIEKFKTIFKKMYNDAQNNIYSNRIEAIYKLFDEYNLWNCMSHKYSNQISPLEIRRIFCHILTSAQIAENRKTKNINNKYFIDVAQSIIEKGEIALSSYSIESEVKTNQNSIDVITIHSSKGLTYDKIVVLGEQDKDFFGGYENMQELYGGYGKQYKALFNIDFKDILKKNPEIKVSYFPYLGSVPAYILRRKDMEGKELWKGSKELYNKVKDLIISESLNLLYVALTRSKKDIIFINLVKKEKKENTKKTSQKKENEITKYFEGFKCFVYPEEKKEKTSQTVDKPIITYISNENKFEQMDITKSVKTKSVRSEIKTKLNQKYEKGVLNSLDRMEKVKIGSMLHNAVQNILPKTTSSQDFIKSVEDTKNYIQEKNSLQYKAIDILSKNKKIIEDNENILKENYKFSNEVPIWHFNIDGTLIKGSIDTLGFKDDKALIIEYKVLFNNGNSQEGLANSQMEEYEKMLEFLKNTNLTIEKKYMPFVDAK